MRYVTLISGLLTTTACLLGFAAHAGDTGVSVGVLPGADAAVRNLAETVGRSLDAPDVPWFLAARTSAKLAPSTAERDEVELTLVSSQQMDGSVDLTSLQPLALLTGEFQVMVVANNSSFATLSDVIDYMRQDPASVRWVVDQESSGSTRAAISEILQRAGVDAGSIGLHVVSGPTAVSGLAATDVTISPLSSVLDLIRAGDVRALATTAPVRKIGLDVPTFSEQGLPASNVNWTFVMVPKSLEAARFDQATAAIEEMVHTSSWRDLSRQDGWFTMYTPADSLGSFATDEAGKILGSLEQAGLSTQ